MLPSPELNKPVLVLPELPMPKSPVLLMPKFPVPELKKPHAPAARAEQLMFPLPAFRAPILIWPEPVSPMPDIVCRRCWQLILLSAGVSNADVVAGLGLAKPRLSSPKFPADAVVAQIRHADVKDPGVAEAALPAQPKVLSSFHTSSA